jgi:outer membrane protein assembly factor BamB
MQVRRLRLAWWIAGCLVLVAAVWGLSGCGSAVAPSAPAPDAVLPDAAADWPHLRGPRYDGIALATGLVAAWSESGPPVLWTTPLGQGFSGFVVVGGKAYTQCQELSGQYLVCLDVNNGAEHWRLRYDAAWQSTGAYPGPYASPTCSDGHVFFASPSGVVGCADADGRLLWSRNLIRDLRGRGAGFGFACTPLVEGGLAMFPVGGPGAGLVALKIEDGSIAWQDGDDQASYCPAYAITWQGRRLVVGFLRNVLVVHDVATGQLLARHVLSSEYDEHSAWPLYREPDLLVASPFKRGAQMMRLLPSDGGIELKTVWMSKELSNDVLSSVLYEGHVYGFDLAELQARLHRSSRGVFRCLDAATGKVKWSTDAVEHASLLVADGKLILWTDTGTLILARADAAEYQELARHAILPDGGMCWTPPTLHGDRLLLRNQERAVCVLLGDAARLSGEQRSQLTTAADLPSGWTWKWTWLVGREPEFPNDAPSWPEFAFWFGVTLMLVALAVIVVAAVGAVAWVWGWPGARSGGWAIFWSACFVLGLIATPLLGHALDRFVWTWPLCLFVGYQSVIETIVAESSHPRQAWARWRSRGVVLAFLALCWLYYAACQQLGLPLLWGFLIGFLPAWPVSALAARPRQFRGAAVVRAIGLLLAYTVCFWSAAAWIAWKTSFAEELL